VNSGQFKPGESGNPKGISPLSGERKTIKHLTAHDFAILFNQIRGMQVEDAKAISKDPDKYSVEYIAMIRIFLKIMATGDMVAYDRLLNRILGKVPDVIHQVDTNSDRLTALLDRLKLEGIE